MRENPRQDIERLIEAADLIKLLEKAAQLHGHYCPGLALGVMAATHAMNLLKIKSDGLDELLAIVENNNCFSDGVQFVTGCSFGNNGLIFKDLGKMAFTLCERKSHGLRVTTKTGSRTYVRNAYSGFSGHYQKVVKEKDHSKAEKIRFKKSGYDAAVSVLKLNFDKIFQIQEVKTGIPGYPPSHESLLCDACSEETMSSRTVEKEGKVFCFACSEHGYGYLDGFGIKTNIK